MGDEELLILCWYWYWYGLFFCLKVLTGNTFNNKPIIISYFEATFCFKFKLHWLENQKSALIVYISADF